MKRVITYIAIIIALSLTSLSEVSAQSSYYKGTISSSKKKISAPKKTKAFIEAQRKTLKQERFAKKKAYQEKERAKADAAHLLLQKEIAKNPNKFSVKKESRRKRKNNMIGELKAKDNIGTGFAVKKAPKKIITAPAEKQSFWARKKAEKKKRKEEKKKEKRKSFWSRDK